LIVLIHGRDLITGARSGISPPARRLRFGVKGSWRWVSVVAPLVMLVGCDHATKYVAKTELEHQPPRELLGSVLDLRYAENTDVAFNALRWIPEGVRGPLLAAVGATALLLIAFMLLRRPGTPASRAGLVLILAGALGNYSDRLVRGYVVDFIHVPHWPVFNVADICVSVGVALLAWTALRHRRREYPT
jgi:signal peptidase II